MLRQLSTSNKAIGLVYLNDSTKLRVRSFTLLSSNKFSISIGLIRADVLLDFWMVMAFKHGNVY